MNCPECGAKLKEVMVNVEGARSKARSLQCSSCGYFSFDKESSQKVLEELKYTPLKIKQRVIKLSKDHLGMYFNANIVRSLGMKKGEEVYVSVPDKKHIILERTIA